MGHYIKLPPRKCNNCGYHASGGAFKKSFGRFWFGNEKCPKCKSLDIVDNTKPKLKR
jgi:predicted Zn-ribbon and HTH transcriptional regulator